FNTTLCQEYAALVHEFGYDQSDLIRVARHAFVAAGAPAALKREMLTEFDQWVAART
ncbi:MAG: hypothetical protein KDE19_01135, partial [Caldilineaceae bacterium]|nr:hypothetical protein [Caldilineaceae bacterium]